MKKMIALGLVLALCLGGCADAKREQAAEKASESISQTTQTSESRELDTESSTVAEEELLTTEADDASAEAEATEELTQTAQLLKLLQAGDMAAETQIKAQSYLYPMELALYDLMQYADDVYEGVDYFSYYENDRYQYLFAWQLAEWEPTIEKKRDSSSVGISKKDFESYYMSLFGEKADIQKLCWGTPPYGNFEEKEDYVYLHYYGGMQDCAPVLKNPRLRFESETGKYRLTMDVLAQKEYYYLNGCYHYVLMGDYLNFSDPTITEYPEEYVYAKVVFHLNKTENDLYFKSIEFEDINYHTYTLAEGQNPYLGKPLTELLDLMPLDTKLSGELLIAVQAALHDDYRTAIGSLALSDDGQIEFRKDYDYLSAPQGKASFVWYQIVVGEKNHPTNFRIEGAENATGMFVVTVENFAKCYRELFGEEADLAQIEEIFAPYDGKISGVGWLPGFESVEPGLKNPMLSYDAASGEYILLMEIVSDEAYFQFDITDYPKEAVSGTITFRMVKTENGYQFRSIVVTD